MNKLLCCAAISTLLVGCGSSDSSPGDVAVEGLDQIVGVYAWDSSVDGDEGYIYIKSSGFLNSYDYDGDSYDMGSNCYYTSENYAEIEHNSGNSFTITFQYWSDQTNSLATAQEDLTIFETSTGLRVNGVNFDDGASYSDLLTSSNLTPSDFAPECND